MHIKNMLDQKKIKELFDKVFSSEETDKNLDYFIINTILAEEFRKDFVLRIKRRGRKNVRI